MASETHPAATAGGLPDKATRTANMARRWPQPVLVSDLAGIPVLDGRLGRLGTVHGVARTDDGVAIVVDHGGFLGLGARRIALPVEIMAMLGRQIVVMDVAPEALDALPAWTGDGARVVPDAETIQVALTKN